MAIKYKHYHFADRINRRLPRNEGDYNSPMERENWLSRNRVLKYPRGTERLKYYSAFTFDTYTKFLLHFQDTFKDELGATPTVFEDAVIQTTDGVFGSSCGLFDGTGDYVSYPDSADYYFGTGDFEIDFRVKFSDLTNAQVIIGQYEGADDNWYIEKGTNAGGNKWKIRFEDGGVVKGEYVMTSAWVNAQTDVWFHVKINRSTTGCNLFIKGVAQTLTETTAFGANDVGNIAAALIIGQQNSTNYLNGKLDELRISKGIARHTAAFTPPTEPYAPDTGTNPLTSIVTWEGRYYTDETGQKSPRTFCYTQDGRLFIVDDVNKIMREVKAGLNQSAYPKSWMIKTGEQYYLYLVDGRDLYKFDGNNDNRFDKITVNDSEGNPVNPIDLIEHKDRLFLISANFLFVSANQDFDTFDSATDSIQLIVGSGKGENVALGTIIDRLFIRTTEGTFALIGDLISALAVTFEIEKVDDIKSVPGRSGFRVEQALVFLGTDAGMHTQIELYAFNGHNSKMLSYDENLSNIINPTLEMLRKASSTYEDGYYKLSFVETGQSIPRLEVWWDSLEVKCEFVRGRNVSCYLSHIDETKEDYFMQMGRSDIPAIVWAERGLTFDGQPIITKLITRDITPIKGMNVRFNALFPEFEPTGQRSLIFAYFLNGRQGVVYQFPKNVFPGDVKAEFTQSLRGEFDIEANYTYPEGSMVFQNQSQFMDRIRPKIRYSRGQSISFIMIDSTYEMRARFRGLMLGFIPKTVVKGRIVGQ